MLDACRSRCPRARRWRSSDAPAPARPRWSTRCCACTTCRRARSASRGRDVTRIPLAELRGLIGYAPQDAFLFSATVADNIAFGIRDDVDAADARRARAARRRGRRPRARHRRAARRLRHAGRRARHHAVGRPAPARGAGARARRRPQILILDDSLSSVDAETERDDPDAAAGRSWRGRTSILISHRVAAVKDADQILVLDAGRVAERGTHASLLAIGRRLRVAVPRAARRGSRGGGRFEWLLEGTRKGPLPRGRARRAKPVGAHARDLLGNALDRTLLRRIFSYVWPYRGLLLLSVVLLPVVALLEIAQPYLLKTRDRRPHRGRPARGPGPRRPALPAGAGRAIRGRRSRSSTSRR